MDEQKLIHDPSQKVLAMYQAVIEFINEGCDINRKLTRSWILLMSM